MNLNTIHLLALVLLEGVSLVHDYVGNRTTNVKLTSTICIIHFNNITIRYKIEYLDGKCKSVLVM